MMNAWKCYRCDLVFWYGICLEQEPKNILKFPRTFDTNCLILKILRLDCDIFKGKLSKRS